MTGPGLDRWAGALDRAGRRYTRKGDHIQASCPGPHHKNGDRDPSLSIDYDPTEAKVLAWCHVCGPLGDMGAVREVLGLTTDDFYDELRGNGQQPREQSIPKPELVCRGHHETHLFGPIGDDPDHPKPGHVWNEWVTASGERAWKVRVPCKRDGCDGRKFAWRQVVLGAVVDGMPSDLLPYRFPELRHVMDNGWRGRVLICEGESDTDAARKHGAQAITAGQALAWSDRHTALLVELGATEAAIAADRDASGLGRRQAEKIKAQLQAIGIHSQIVEALAGKDIRDHLDRGYTLFDLVPVDDHVEPPPPELEEGDIRLLLPRIDWYELWADDSDEEWIIYPLIPERRGVAIYSPAKIGKSLLMLELVVKISLGRMALGYTPSRRRRVLYVDFENDPRGDVRTRLQDMGYGPEDLDHLDYLSFPALTDLNTEQGATRLIAAIKAYGSELVVIDTISRAVIGEENSNDTWLDLYRYTGLSLKQAGVAMIRLDHTGKDESKGQRGGSAKYGDVDAVWKLTKITDDRFRLECTDRRFPLDVNQLNLIRRTDPLRHIVENLSAATEREAKILQIIAMADKAQLSADASRRDLQELGKAHHVRAGTGLYNEAAQRRKARKVVPDPGDRGSDHRGSQSLGPAGTEPPILSVNRWSPALADQPGPGRRADWSPVPPP